MSKKESNTINTLSFDCYYGDVKTEENVKLKIKEPGVYIHFLRLGLFDKNLYILHKPLLTVDNPKGNSNSSQSKNKKLSPREIRFNRELGYLREYKIDEIQKPNFSYRYKPLDKSYVPNKTEVKGDKSPLFLYEKEQRRELEQILFLGKKLETQQAPEIPKLDNFYLAPTALNEGYIYLINYDDVSDYCELEVLSDGKMRNISWDYKKNISPEGEVLDVRVSNNEKSFSSKRVDPEGKKYWVAYSPFQWYKKYHDSILNDSELRKKQMKLIYTDSITIGEKPIKKKDNQILPIPYNEVCLCFNDVNDPRINDLQEKIKDIEAHELQEAKNDKNNVYQDLFFTLEDSLGCINDVCGKLMFRHQEHSALIGSMQTGRNEYKILKDLINNKITENTLSDDELQYSSLYSTALTTYHLIYSNDDMKNKYESTTGKGKILNILGVEERKELREKIAITRADFAKLLDSSFYQKFVNQYINYHKCTTTVFALKYFVCAHLDILAQHPHHKDRHIDLIKDYTGNNDVLTSFFSKTLKKGHVINELLLTKTKLEEIQEAHLDKIVGFTVIRKFTRAIKSIVDSYAKYVVSARTFAITLDYVKAFEYGGESIIQVKKSITQAKVPKNFGIDLNKWGTKLVHGKHGQSKNFFKISTEILSESADEIIASEKLKVPIQGKGTNAGKWIEGITSHPRFRFVMVSIELMNTISKHSSYTGSLKGNVKLAGAYGHLLSASTSYLESKLLLRGFEKTMTPMKFLSATSKIMGFVGTGVTVLMCFNDCLESIKYRDYDAALMWGLAGVLGTIVLANSIFVYIVVGAAGLAAWPLGILIALVFFCTGKAIYDLDTPIERFLKNSVLSSHAYPQNSGVQRPFQKIRTIYKYREILAPNKEFRDFKKCSQILNDLLISYRVTNEHVHPLPFERHDFFTMDNVRQMVNIKAGTELIKYKTIKIQISLRKFLYNISKYEYSLHLFINGIEAPSWIDEILNPSDMKISINEGKSNIVDLSYSLSTTTLAKINIRSEFVFISRVVISEKLDQYWPPQEKRIKRYTGYKFSPIKLLSQAGPPPLFSGTLEGLFGDNVRIGKEIELLSVKKWK